MLTACECASPPRRVARVACGACPASAWAPFPWPDLDPREWDALRGLLALRAATRWGTSCEVCGEPFTPGGLEPSVHHRRARHMGGTGDPAVHGLANLVLACGGHLAGVVGCHGWIEHNPAAAAARGLTVEWGSYLGDGSSPPPEITVPVVLATRRRVLLDPTSPAYLPPGDGVTWAA